MQLTDKQITEFQTLYHKHFGERITKERAREEGLRLIQLIELVYKPDELNDDE